MKIDIPSAAARARYQASVDFARDWRPLTSSSARRRALLTGFGRFPSVADNTSGRIVAALAPRARYPAGEAELSVALQTIALPRAGEIELCAMILPVCWDLAPILVAKQIEVFGPEVVLMSGVASEARELWIELGGLNRAVPLAGADGLMPAGSALIQDAGERAYRLSFGAVAEAALESKLLPPRESNAYVCNNLAYVVDWLMDCPGQPLSLLEDDQGGGVRAVIERDTRAVPRGFLHWPSHAPRGAETLAAILDAQLTTREPPARRH